MVVTTIIVNNYEYLVNYLFMPYWSHPIIVVKWDGEYESAVINIEVPALKGLKSKLFEVL